MKIASERLYFEPYHKQYRASFSSAKRVCVTPIKKLFGGHRPWGIALELHSIPVENSRPIKIQIGDKPWNIRYSLKPDIKRPRGQFFWGIREYLGDALQAAGFNAGLHTLYLVVKEI